MIRSSIPWARQPPAGVLPSNSLGHPLFVWSGVNPLAIVGDLSSPELVGTGSDFGVKSTVIGFNSAVTAGNRLRWGYNKALDLAFAGPKTILVSVYFDGVWAASGLSNQIFGRSTADGTGFWRFTIDDAGGATFIYMRSSGSSVTCGWASGVVPVTVGLRTWMLVHEATTADGWRLYADGKDLGLGGSGGIGTLDMQGGGADKFCVGAVDSQATRGMKCTAALVHVSRGVIPSREVGCEVTRNPWQLFQPITRRIFVSAAGGGVTAALTGQSTTIAQGTVVGAVAAPVTGQSLEVTKAIIQFDAASNSGLQTAQSAYSFAHTCTGKDGTLIVGVSMATSTLTVSTITYNGVALGYLRNESFAPLNVEAYALASPSIGTFNVVVTLTGACDSIAAATSYTGVQAIFGIDALNGNVGTGPTDASVISTTTIKDCFVLDVISTNDAAITVGAGQTQRVNVSGAALTLGMSAEGPKTPQGAVTMSWSGIDAAKDWAMVSLAMRPKSGAAGLLTAAIQPAITGQAVTASQGVISPVVANAITGQAASIAQGTAAAAVSYPVTGQALAVATGSVGVTVSPALSGQAVTVAQGDVVVAGGVSVALTGQGMSVAQGTLAAAVAGSVTGQSAALATGTLVGAIASPITGQGATISQGAVAGAVAAPLTGQGVTISLGAVAGGDVVRALTGASLTISQGSVTNAAASIEVIQPTTYPGTKKQRLHQNARAVAKRRKEEAEAAKAAIAESSIVEELPRINRLKVENSLAAKFGEEIPNENGDIITLDIEQEALNKRSRMFLILARAALLAA